MIAGPNGSGKSTLTDLLIEEGAELGTYINADQIAAKLDLPEPLRSKRAQAIADLERDRCLSGGVSFSFETVMSHPSKIDVMIRANEAGYEVTLYFVCTSEPNINIARVANRVRRGGHDVPKDRIVSRYHRTLGLLSDAALAAAHTILFDNSSLSGADQKKGLRPVGEVVRDGNNYAVTLDADVPEWVTEHLVGPLNAAADQSNGAVRLTIARRSGLLA
uniref:Zeta toxin domain-containing protein n=1 Tax=Rhodopseudomonas palustris (strain BisA53) TaxID=316055 RepID=Q07PA5_RHOP5